jgi:hypothetical protein
MAAVLVKAVENRKKPATPYVPQRAVNLMKLNHKKCSQPDLNKDHYDNAYRKV